MLPQQSTKTFSGPQVFVCARQWEGGQKIKQTQQYQVTVIFPANSHRFTHRIEPLTKFAEKWDTCSECTCRIATRDKSHKKHHTGGKNICIPEWVSGTHDDVIKWKHFPRYWPFVRGIHWSRWIPRTKASGAELWCFLWSSPESTIE